MVKYIRYPLGAVFVPLRQPLGNTPIYATSAHIVVHIAKLGAQLFIYVMYRVMVIDDSLRYISYSLFHFIYSHINNAGTHSRAVNVPALSYPWRIDISLHSLACAIGRVAPIDID